MHPPIGGDRRPARIYREMELAGARFWTLFDSGSRGTYAVASVGAVAGLVRARQPKKRAIGGRTYTITQACPLVGKVEGYEIMAIAFVVDRLFPDEKGRPIEIIVGMEAMETWGIWLDMPNKRLDFTHYQKEAYEG